MSVDHLRSGLLEGLPHGFLGRGGGVSGGMLEGLNVGYGSNDEIEWIERNRAIAIAAIAPGAELATVHQVHSAEAVEAHVPWPRLARPHADAIVTSRRGLLIGILTADCAPVLLADPIAQVIGAAHAGWRGALGGVTDSTIAAMERLGAKRERIQAAVGPCIAQPSYEVDEGFRDRFLNEDGGNDRFFAPGASGRPYFDLAAYVLHRLNRAGLGRAEALGIDTYAEEQRFYSFRRATLRGEPDYGRQLSAIALPAG